ncbi:MAG: DUF4350 domain-containing protein [Roseiflexaceae bacterium]
MKNRRDLFILAGLFLALILFVAIGPRLRPSDTENAGLPTSRSTEDRGTQALYTWLGRIGYDARRLEYRAFELDENDDALLIFNPIESIGVADADAILGWVEQGGTLIFANDGTDLFVGNDLLDQLDVRIGVYTTTETITSAQTLQPVFDQPPTGELLVNTGRVLQANSPDYVTLAGTEDADLLIGIKRGRGYIYLSSATYLFTNAGLRHDANAALVLNLLRRVPAGGRIQFDEYHLGFYDPPSPTATLLSNPLGWGAAYAVLAIALYLALSGRRFGRPVPVREELARRSSAEYVESMADLLQRAGQRGYVLKHYHTILKRRLAAPAGISPQMDDAAFVRELARFREVDEAALSQLLARLRSNNLSEPELVRAVAEAEELVRSSR